MLPSSLATHIVVLITLFVEKKLALFDIQFKDECSYGDSQKKYWLNNTIT